MKDIEGKKRVVIQNIEPEIDCGRYAAKRVVGELFTVRADVFADGHDVVRAALLYKKEKKNKWVEVDMQSLGNDRWEARVTFDEVGIYEFTVKGWVDHFLTWRSGFKKKREAGNDLSVELQIGKQMVESVAASAPSKEKKRLMQWAENFDSGSNRQSLDLALDNGLAETIDKLEEKQNASTYHKNLKVVVERKKALFSSWYELFPRSAAATPGIHGTFNDVERLLPRIAEMGFDVLYLPPIHPIGKKFRKGKNNSLEAAKGEPGSPWAIGSEEGGHKAIHQNLGTPEEFRHLVKQAKAQGIEVALDIALQCSPDHPYVKEHPQWFKWRPDGTVQYAENPPKKYQDILPINFETEDWQNLWRELKSIFDHWIKQGVRIFRVDNPHTKPFSFWEWLITEVQKKNPDVIFLAEAFTRPRIMECLAKLGFTQSYTYFTWRVEGWELKQYIQELTQTEAREYFRPNFWPNTPDILPYHLMNAGEPAFVIRALLAATLSSNYGIYGPAYEHGVNVQHPPKEEYYDSEKYEIKEWDWEKQTTIREAITKINRVRKENFALQQNANIIFCDTDNDNFFSFVKYEGDNLIAVVINLDPVQTHKGWVKMPLFELEISRTAPYTVNDVFNGYKYTWRDEWNYIELNPNISPIHVFRIEEFTHGNWGKSKKQESNLSGH